MIGTGHQIDLYTIKVLIANSSGYLSDVIEGIDWGIANKMQVINMSLETNPNFKLFYYCDYVAVAGNSGGSESVIFRRLILKLLRFLPLIRIICLLLGPVMVLKLI